MFFVLPKSRFVGVGAYMEGAIFRALVLVVVLTSNEQQGTSNQTRSFKIEYAQAGASSSKIFPSFKALLHSSKNSAVVLTDKSI
jgi:hypothetical protein